MHVNMLAVYIKKAYAIMGIKMLCCDKLGDHATIDVGSVSDVIGMIEECRVVLLLFYTDTCGVCRAFTPIYDAVARSYHGYAAFLKVDANRFYKLAAELGVMSVPSTIIIVDGKLVSFLTGFIDGDRLSSIVENVLEHSGCRPGGGRSW